MIRRAAASFWLVSCLLGAGAYDWPVESPVAGSAFGQWEGGHFGVGVSLATPSGDVHPIAAGEVVFRYDPARRPSTLPRGLGAHVVIQHAEAVRSAYTYLAPSSVTTAETVARTAVIGRVGDSGAALGPFLGLYVYDMDTVSYLNPLMVMPSLADRQPPVIARVLLKRGDEVLELADHGAAISGAVSVLVEAYDLREDLAFRWRLAPFSVSLSVNGRQTAAVAFDSIRAEGDRLTDGRGRTADGAYAGPWILNLGEVQLQRGESQLRVFARDFAGNESTRELTLSIGG